MCPHGLRGELDGARLDGQRAPCWHGITCVDHDVQQYLLELPGVDLDVARTGRETRLELDVLADDAAEHAIHVRDDRVRVEHFRLQRLLPAECEQLPRQQRRTLRCRFD